MACGCIKDRELVLRKYEKRQERKSAHLESVFDPFPEPPEPKQVAWSDKQVTSSYANPYAKQPSRRGRDNRLLSKRQNRHRSRAEHRRNNDGVT